jgi:hypothetical protein
VVWGVAAIEVEQRRCSKAGWATATVREGLAAVVSCSDLDWAIGIARLWATEHGLLVEDKGAA